MKPDIIVPYSQPDLAVWGTVEGWIGKDGRYYGKTPADEYHARWGQCTHLPCETCGELKGRSSWCKPCDLVKRDAKYAALPRQAWDGECMLVPFDGDHFFCSPEEVLDWCAGEDVNPRDLRLQLTYPKYAGPINPCEYYADDLPEHGEVPGEVAEAFDRLNKTLEAKKEVLGWFPDDAALCEEEVAELEEEWRAEAKREQELNNRP